MGSDRPDALAALSRALGEAVRAGTDAALAGIGRELGEALRGGIAAASR